MVKEDFYFFSIEPYHDIFMVLFEKRFVIAARAFQRSDDESHPLTVAFLLLKYCLHDEKGTCEMVIFDSSASERLRKTREIWNVSD